MRHPLVSLLLASALFVLLCPGNVIAQNSISSDAPSSSVAISPSATSSTSAAPSETDPPKHELRAIWLTTVFGLDWPSQNMSASQQRAELREIFRLSDEMGINAVFFQVVSRGDSFYPSSRLPWAPWLTGNAGEDPGWDPLEVAIEEAHKRGMEIHAWYNVFSIGNDATQVSASAEPLHVRFSHPEWVDTVFVEHGADRYWINPGYPDVREWSVRNVMEIVENYDIDAIHLDYLRYQSGGFASDEELFSQYNPEGYTDINAWRRNNLNEFIRDLYPAVKELKPWVKVGSAPIGGYQNFPGAWPGFWGYDDTFQDARAWVAEGIQDYIVPQLYSTIGREPVEGREHDSPDFAWLLQDWYDNRAGRHVYAGLGTYVPDVREELAIQIDTSRAIGAKGQAHFRYDSLDAADLHGRYDRPALIPPMEWKMQREPPSPLQLTANKENAATGQIRIAWEKPSMGRDPDPFLRFAVYRTEHGSYIDAQEVISNVENLLGVTGQTEFEDTPSQDHSGREYDYFVTSLNRNYIESPPAQTSVTITSSDDAPEIAETVTLHQNYPNPFNPVTVISYTIPESMEVRLDVYNSLGQRVASLVGKVQEAGRHKVPFDATSLASGVYTYRLQAGDYVSTRKMTVIR